MSQQTKKWLRHALSLIIVLGVAVALWPAGQLVYAQWNQRQLQNEWQNAARAKPRQSATSNSSARNSSERKMGGGNQTSRKTNGRASTPIADWPSTRIIIPDIGLDAVVVQGVDADALRRGPGHEPRTALPGQPGNCVIAAHRNAYGLWFYKVDQLWPGSRITLRTPRESYEYQIVSITSVGDTDTSVLNAPREKNAPPRLTLITCTIPRTTSRIIVIAHLLPPETGGFE
jgi:sortase A